MYSAFDVKFQVKFNYTKIVKLIVIFCKGIMWKITSHFYVLLFHLVQSEISICYCPKQIQKAQETGMDYWDKSVRES